MGHRHTIAIVMVVGAALCACAKTQTNTSQSANPSPAADAEARGSPPEEARTADANPQAAAPKPDIRATCPLEVERQIACKDEYIPMIVGVRIKLDFPPGTAERGRDEAGRQKLEALAMQEFPEYYSMEKIPAICEERQAMAERMPPEMIAELSALGPDCHTEKDCEGFTRCVAPMVERILAWTAAAGPR